MTSNQGPVEAVGLWEEGGWGHLHGLGDVVAPPCRPQVHDAGVVDPAQRDQIVGADAWRQEHLQCLLAGGRGRGGHAEERGVVQERGVAEAVCPELALHALGKAFPKNLRGMR